MQAPAVRQQRVTYSVRTAASMLDCSPGHVRDLVRRGDLRKADGCGRNWLIVAADVHRLAGADVPGHEALSSAHELADLQGEMQRWLLEGHRLLERLSHAAQS